MGSLLAEDSQAKSTLLSFPKMKLKHQTFFKGPLPRDFCGFMTCWVTLQRVSLRLQHPQLEPKSANKQHV